MRNGYTREKSVDDLRLKWLRDRSLITSQGGTILKQAPFWGVHFSLVKNMKWAKFYDSNSNLGNLTSVVCP